MEYSNDNKLNQPSAESEGQNFSNTPPQNSNRNLKIIIGVLIVLLVGILGVAGYYIFANKTAPQNEQPNPTNSQSVLPTPNSTSTLPNNNSESGDSLKQKIMDKYGASQMERKNPVIDYSLVTPNYDFDYEGGINIEVKHDGKTIGSFEGYNGGDYVPVYEKNNELFIVSYCGGIGGMCRGDFTKYNILTRKITKITDNTLDFFMSNDSKKIIIFTVADDWLTFKVWTYDFETDQMIDQSITLKCSILSNIRKNCVDLFLQNDQELVYVPLDYDDIKVGDAFKLTMVNNLKAMKFSITADILNQYNIVSPVSN